jgi:hypothetical protein
MPLAKRSKIMLVFGAVFGTLGVTCWAAFIFVTALLRARAATELIEAGVQLPIIRGDLTTFMPQRDDPTGLYRSVPGNSFERLQALQRPGLRIVWNELCGLMTSSNPDQDIELDSLVDEEEHPPAFLFSVLDSTGTTVSMVLRVPNPEYALTYMGAGPISSLVLVESSGWVSSEFPVPSPKLIGKLPERLGRADQLVFEESDKNWSLAGLRTICVIENGALRILRQLRWGNAWDEW